LQFAAARQQPRQRWNTTGAPAFCQSGVSGSAHRVRRRDRQRKRRRECQRVEANLAFAFVSSSGSRPHAARREPEIVLSRPSKVSLLPSSETCDDR